jgi:chorismate--pyruvate lyase
MYVDYVYECFFNVPGDVTDDSTPLDVELVGAPRVKRHVWLKTKSGQRLAYATSWWDAAVIESNLTDTKLPIWVNLTSNRAELYRDVSCER